MLQSENEDIFHSLLQLWCVSDVPRYAESVPKSHRVWYGALS